MAEVFQNFEVNRTPRWPRLLRLTGVSFVLHILFFLAILYVPFLREAFHIADRFSDAEYVDEEYEKTQIRDAVMVETAQRFQYPPGYFTQPPDAQVVATPTPMPTPRPTPTPTPTPSPSPTPEPTPQGAEEAANVKEPQTKEEADKAIDEVAAKSGVIRPRDDKINKKPLKDWLASSNVLYRDGKLNLNSTIEVVIVARRDAKGKLHDPQVVRKTGDPVLVEVAQELVAAINDSNILYFLEGTGDGEVRFTVRLDSAQIVASVESEVESEARAQKMAVVYGSMLFLGKKAKSDKDEGIIYENTRVSSKGKQIVVNFSLSRQTAGEMLKKQLPAG